MSTINTIIGTGAIALALAASGCVVAIGNRGYDDGPDNERWYVESEEMRSIVNANKQLELGLTQDEALALYDKEFATLMSSAKVGERVVEEWRVQAYEGSRKNVKSRFRRWLYFADGTLVRFSEERIDYASHPSMVESWQ